IGRLPPGRIEETFTWQFCLWVGALWQRSGFHTMCPLLRRTKYRHPLAFVRGTFRGISSTWSGGRTTAEPSVCGNAEWSHEGSACNANRHGKGRKSTALCTQSYQIETRRPQVGAG